jgi:hypothetical protein
MELLQRELVCRGRPATAAKGERVHAEPLWYRYCESLYAVRRAPSDGRERWECTCRTFFYGTAIGRVCMRCGVCPVTAAKGESVHAEPFLWYRYCESLYAVRTAEGAQWRQWKVREYVQTFFMVPVLREFVPMRRAPYDGSERWLSTYNESVVLSI